MSDVNCLLQAYHLEPYDNPPHIDNAKQEYEALPSKVVSGYDNLHKKTSDFFNVSSQFFEFFDISFCVCLVYTKTFKALFAANQGSSI